MKETTSRKGCGGRDMGRWVLWKIPVSREYQCGREWVSEVFGFSAAIVTVFEVFFFFLFSFFFLFIW